MSLPRLTRRMKSASRPKMMRYKRQSRQGVLKRIETMVFLSLQVIKIGTISTLQVILMINLSQLLKMYSSILRMETPRFLFRTLIRLHQPQVRSTLTTKCRQQPTCKITLMSSQIEKW